MDIFKIFNITRFDSKLDNGIKVFLFYKQGAPITATAILRSGSCHDTDDMPGISHFLEHMITNGSEGFPSKDLLAEHIESIGGSYGAMTNQEAMWVHTEVSEREDFSRVVDVFNATLCTPLMDKKVFENEKNVVVKEIKRSDSNAERVLTKTVRRLFFKDTPFEHEVLGDENSILNIDYERALFQHKKLFDKSRIAFIIAGDIGIQEVVDNLNKLVFIEGNDFIPEEKEFLKSTEIILSNYFEAPQTQIFLGIIAPPTFSKENDHLMILGNVLAGGRNSRLTKRLRYEKGLIYDVGHSKIGGISFSTWGIRTNTAEDKVQEVINEIIKEFKDIKENGIKQSELDFIKNRRIKSLKRSMQTSSAWVDSHELAMVFSKEPYDINTYIKNTQDTTLEDIKNVIDKYFVLENWKLALTGKTKPESINLNW